MNQLTIEGFFKDEKRCLKISALALFHLTLSNLSENLHLNTYYLNNCELFHEIGGLSIMILKYMQL